MKRWGVFFLENSLNPIFQEVPTHPSDSKSTSQKIFLQKKYHQKSISIQKKSKVMAILQRENEAFVLTHMAAALSDVQYVEPLEALQDPDVRTIHIDTPEEIKTETGINPYRNRDQYLST